MITGEILNSLFESHGGFAACANVCAKEINDTFKYKQDNNWLVKFHEYKPNQFVFLSNAWYQTYKGSISSKQTFEIKYSDIVKYTRGSKLEKLLNND